MPVRLGVPHAISGLTEIVRNPIHSTGVGLLQFGYKHGAHRTPAESEGGAFQGGHETDEELVRGEFLGGRAPAGGCRSPAGSLSGHRGSK